MRSLPQHEYKWESKQIGELVADPTAKFLKTWLRSQYSTRIRERKKGARPENWDRIGTEFHRWLRGSHDDIGLKTRDDFCQFVVRDLDFYSRQYERILTASSGQLDPDSPLRFVRYNADLGFTLQDQLLLAPLKVDDNQATIDHKLEIVGRFTDILLARRIWNFRSTAYSTMAYAMFTVMRRHFVVSMPAPSQRYSVTIYQDRGSFRRQRGSVRPPTEPRPASQEPLLPSPTTSLRGPDRLRRTSS